MTQTGTHWRIEAHGPRRLGEVTGRSENAFHVSHIDGQRLITIWDERTQERLHIPVSVLPQLISVLQQIERGGDNRTPIKEVGRP